MEQMRSSKVTVILWILFFGIIVHLFLHLEEIQHTFKTYYYAGVVVNEEGNPYDIDLLRDTAHNEGVLPYVYSPPIHELCRLLPALKFSAASTLYLGMKVISFLLLVAIWVRGFRIRNIAGILFISIFAFNYALYFDLVVGNISIFEQLFLWLGLACFMRQRRLCFCLLTILAAFPKITLGFFLILLLLEDKPLKQRLYWFFGSVAAFLSVYLLAYCIYPEMSIEFFQRLFNIVPLDQASQAALYNKYPPALWPMIRGVAFAIGDKAQMQLSTPLPLAVYLLMMTIISYYGWKVFRATKRYSPFERSRFNVILVCFLYILLVPRLLTYSYILMIPAVVIVAELTPIVTGWLWIGTLALISTDASRPFGISILVRELVPFYPVVFTLILWTAYVVAMIKNSKNRFSEK